MWELEETLKHTSEISAEVHLVNTVLRCVDTKNKIYPQFRLEIYKTVTEK